MQYATKLTTIADAMATTAPTLATLQRAKGKEFLLGFTMAWLMYLNDILNLNKPMTEDQIELCAAEINEAYYTLKMSDLTYLFRRIIGEHYGEFYESLTISKVLSFFRDYFEQRCTVAAELSLRSHRDFASQDEFNYSRNLQRIFKGASKRA